MVNKLTSSENSEEDVEYDSEEDSEELSDVWHPYVDPKYQGPYSTLDAYPDLVEQIQTQTLRPELIIQAFRKGLDTNLLNIRALKLSANNVANIVMPFLEQNPQITELKIDGNDIGDRGAKLIATNQTIKKLDASLNNITDTGIMALCQNKNITCLYVSFNRLTEQGIKALANNSTLTELRISLEQTQNRINVQALNFFFKNDTLNTLRCPGAGVSADIAESFRKELMRQRALRDKDRKISFLMGCDTRLGRNSPILPFYEKGGKEMVSEIFSYIKPTSFNFI